MGRSVFIFIFLLICLGLGTAWVVEKNTGTVLIPHTLPAKTQASLHRIYTRTKIQVEYWWSRLNNRAPKIPGQIPVQTTPGDDKKIIKWQDEKGVWHFEYEKGVAPQNAQ